MSEKPPSIPVWMQQTESYQPPSDRDHYFEKTILELTSLFARARRVSQAETDWQQSQQPSRKWNWQQNRQQDSLKRSKRNTRVHPALLLFQTIYLILLLSFSESLYFVLILLAVVLTWIATQPAKRIGFLLLPGIGAAAFTVVILLPAASIGGYAPLLLLPLKVFISVSLIRALSILLPWNQLSRAISFYHVPDLFILTLDMTLRSIFLLGDIALSLLEALKLRSIGKNPKKNRAVTGILGVTLLKAQKLSLETSEAMLCRGFQGTYRSSRITLKFSIKPGRKDIFSCIFLLLITLLFLYFRQAVKASLL